MIRRLSYALLALLLLTSSAAQASSIVSASDRSTGRVLIVLPKPTSAEVVTDNDAFGASQARMKRNVYMLSRLILQTGGSVGYVDAEQTKTEWIRNGYTVRGGVFGSSGASAPGYVDQYDAVVYFGPSLLSGVAGRVRPDSMSRYTKYPKVPFAWIGQSVDIASTAFGAYQGSGPSPLDTSGCEDGAMHYVYNGARMPGTNISWNTMSYTQGMRVSASPNSRTLIVPVVQARASNYLDAEITGTNCLACSEARPEGDHSGTPDSAFVIKKVWTDIADAKPFVVGVFNMLAMSDSTGIDQPTEGEMSIGLSILAVLDSASGGRVFGSKTVIMAPVMDKGLHRGQRRGPNGIFAADTAGHYAIVDSIKANGIPLTVAFDTDLDTLAAYSRDLIKYAQAPSIHFTPQVWTGVMDTTSNGYRAKGAQASKYRVVDPFGRWRNRAAMGAASSAVDDTSMYSLLYSMRVRGDSILTAFGVSGSRISRIAMAPDDDWSPLLLRRSACMCPCPDSVLYAVKQAGFAGIVVDVQDAETDATRGGTYANTNPRGWFGKEMNYRSKFLNDFKLLGHAGYPWMGGRAQFSTRADSIAPFDSTNVGIQYMELCRAWYGAFLDQDRSYDVWPWYGDQNIVSWPYWDNNHFHKADFIYGLRGPAHIVRFSASDFSGAPAAPAANGYHVLRSIQQACRAINAIAGRTIVRLGYPDEITP